MKPMPVMPCDTAPTASITTPSSPLTLKRDFDRLLRQEVHLLDRERDRLGLRRLAQAGAAAEQAVDAFGEHDDVGVNDPAFAVGAHADAGAIGVEDQFERGRLGQHDRARRPDLAREPLVELRADDRVAVGARLVEGVGAIMDAGVGVLAHHPEALLDQMPFERRILTEVGDDGFEHVGVHDRALDVLRAGVFAPLELKDAEPLRGQGVGRRVAGHAGADDDAIEFFDHGSRLLQPASRSLACGEMRARNASVSAGRKRMASVATA